MLTNQGTWPRALRWSNVERGRSGAPMFSMVSAIFGVIPTLFKTALFARRISPTLRSTERQDKENTVNHITPNSARSLIARSRSNIRINPLRTFRQNLRMDTIL